LFTLYIVAGIANALISILAFFQYLRMRMANRPVPEKKWITIHFITLALFIFFGVLVLVHLSSKLNSQHQL
jgi:high-affinity Fe2+/Pb2+ permease